MSKKAEQARGLLNTTELAKRSGLNRATVKTKLETKGVQPRQEKAKEKLYDADEALAVLQQDGTTGLRKAQTAKTAAEAARTKLKLDRERGELVSIQEVREDVQELVKRIHQHFAVTGPTVLAPQLKGKKVSQVEAALKKDAEDFFNDLRATYKAYL
jgi:DNA-binding IclR family transcriptional regulator